MFLAKSYSWELLSSLSYVVELYLSKILFLVILEPSRGLKGPQPILSAMTLLVYVVIEGTNHCSEIARTLSPHRWGPKKHKFQTQCQFINSQVEQQPKELSICTLYRRWLYEMRVHVLDFQNRCFCSEFLNPSLSSLDSPWVESVPNPNSGAFF